MTLTETQRAFFEAEKQKHVDELNNISARAAAVAKQYEALANAEIEAIENIDCILIEEQLL